MECEALNTAHDIRVEVQRKASLRHIVSVTPLGGR